MAVFFWGSAWRAVQLQSAHMWLELEERTRAADRTLTQTCTSSCRGWRGVGGDIRKRLEIEKCDMGSSV